jgi:putative peptidoglycan lipid II flippase
MALVRATTLVSLAFVISRMLGFVRVAIIQAQLGYSPELDAYLAAFRIPDLIFELIAGGALGSAFIPTFTAYLTRDNTRRAMRFASTIINLVFVVLLCLGLVMAWLAPWLVAAVVAPAFPPAQQMLTADLMRVMLIATIIFGVSGIVMGILNAQQHFLAPALAPIIYNLGIIGGALFLEPRFGVLGLTFGVGGGALGHLLIQLPALRRHQFQWQPILTWRDAGVREVMRLMGPRMAGIALNHANFLVNTALASGLATGSIAALDNARLLMLLPHGIIAQALATTIFPTFATQVARNDLAQVRATLISVLRALLFFILPATVGLFIAREPLIALLLQRGKFTGAATQLTAYALAFYAPALVAYAITEILTRAFYALRDTRTPVVIAGATIMLNITFSLILVGALGIGGLALANLLASLVEALGLWWLLRRRLGGFDGLALMRASAPSLLASIIMGGCVWLFSVSAAGQSVLVVALGCLLVGAGSYIGAAWALRAQEIMRAQHLIGRRFKVWK